MEKHVYPPQGTAEGFVLKACEILKSQGKNPIAIIGFAVKEDGYGIGIASVEENLPNLLRLLQLAVKEIEQQIKSEIKNN